MRYRVATLVLPEPLRAFVPAVAFAVGAAIGSFLNVVIYRLPRDEEGLSIAYPAQSFCPKCKTPIRAYDNIPLLSYFVLAGKCRSCKVKIPFRYFFVELLTACLFALTALALEERSDLGLIAVECALIAALIACTFIDIDLQIIPDKIDIPGMLLAPVASLLVPALHWHRDLEGRWGFHDLDFLGSLAQRLDVALPSALAEPRVAALASSLLGILVGAGIIWGIGIVGSFVFRKEAMGFGDVKYMGMIGGFIGWPGVLLGLLLACLTGAAIGISRWAFAAWTRSGEVVRRARRLAPPKQFRSEPAPLGLMGRYFLCRRVARIAAGSAARIPFGPFLSLGALGMILARDEIVRFIFVDYPRWAVQFLRFG